MIEIKKKVPCRNGTQKQESIELNQRRNTTALEFRSVSGHQIDVESVSIAVNDVQKMAIDYIIGALQLVSAAVNILALGSFWITPGLRTTANRFVINLLIVNIVGCIALTPALWLHDGLIPMVHMQVQPIYDADNSSSALPGMEAAPPAESANVFALATNTAAPANEPLIVELEDHGKGIGQGGVDIGIILADERPSEDQNFSLFGETNDDNNRTAPSPTRNIRYSDCTRFWGFDLVAALGKTHAHI